jgi:hypothetical protein
MPIVCRLFVKVSLKPPGAEAINKIPGTVMNDLRDFYCD